MWLLDANMDIHLLALFQQFGQKTEATTKRGWGALNNGDLVSIAVKEGFACLLTQDRLFAEAAARALKAHPDFSVVVVHLPQCSWPKYQESFKASWLKSPIVPAPGKVTHWP